MPTYGVFELSPKLSDAPHGNARRGSVARATPRPLQSIEGRTVIDTQRQQLFRGDRDRRRYRRALSQNSHEFAHPRGMIGIGACRYHRSIHDNFSVHELGARGLDVGLQFRKRGDPPTLENAGGRQGDRGVTQVRHGQAFLEDVMNDA